MARELAPAFQFYPKDFLTDSHVLAMSLQERGAYITLLCSCWLEGSLSSDPPTLAKLLGIPLSAFRKFWPAIKPCFRETDDGRLSQKRLDVEREKQARFRRRQSDKGIASAAAKVNRGATTVQPEVNQSVVSLVQPEVNSSIFHLPSPKEQIQERARVSADERDAKTQADNRERMERQFGAMSPPPTHELAERARAFIDRYCALYEEHRKGAKYLRRRDQRDHEAALSLCGTWDDERLEKLAIIFLNSDLDFAERGPRTLTQFASIASWCDGKLAEHEAQRRLA